MIRAAHFTKSRRFATFSTHTRQVYPEAGTLHYQSLSIFSTWIFIPARYELGNAREYGFGALRDRLPLDFSTSDKHFPRDMFSVWCCIRTYCGILFLSATISSLGRRTVGRLCCVMFSLNCNDLFPWRLYDFYMTNEGLSDSDEASPGLRNFGGVSGVEHCFTLGLCFQIAAHIGDYDKALS